MLPDVQHKPAAQEDPTLPRVSSVQPSMPTTLEQNWNWFLNTLGIVLAFGAGIAAGFGLPAWEGHVSEAQLLLISLAMFAVGLLAAGALRSLWAILFVPIAVYAGNIVASSVFGISWGWLFFVSLPAAIGAFIGASIGIWATQRIRR